VRCLPFRGSVFLVLACYQQDSVGRGREG
jgi:hypothetical protein